MLKKLSSDLSSARLRKFVKKANIIGRNMNVHKDGTMANQIYSQLAAAPKSNNRVGMAFPMVERKIPIPPAPSTYNRLI